MKTLRIFQDNINTRYIEETVKTLREGALIAFPTDTFYAIGCNALDNNAIEKLCRLKKIDPRKNFLSVICSDISQASKYARIDNQAFRIIRQNTPGPFTFILSAATSLPKVFKGRKEVGLRIPDNTIPRMIAEQLGNPILATTATSDDTKITVPEMVNIAYENTVDILIDDGELPGIGTTIVELKDSSSPEIIREGAGTLL